MENPIFTTELKNKLYEILPATLTAQSAFDGTGAQAVAKETDALVWYGVGGAALLGEGEKHTLADVSVDEKDIYRAKLSQVLVFTQETLDRAEGSAISEELIGQAVDSLAPSFDIVIANGTSPSTGALRADLAGKFISGNSLQHVFTEGAGNFDQAIEAAMRSVPTGRQMLLSDAGWAEYAFINTAQGLPKYPTARYDGEFYHRWLRAKVASQIGKTGWTADGTALENNVLGMVGDFTQIVRGLDYVTVKETDTATIGGSSMFEEDKIAVKVTVGVRFAVKNLAKLVTIKSA
jgi:hypothetical protein